MEAVCASAWKDYELIDTGGFEKIERFGEYILIRPEPQALWDKSMKAGEWEKLAHVKFIPQSSNSGTWMMLKEMPRQWNISYKLKEVKLTFRLGLTAFKHIGIFPEQSVNWDFIFGSIKKIKSEDIKVLNLFAYTGASTLAASGAGAVVTHVDSVKQVVNWAKDNARESSAENIRWIIDDAVKFVNREIRRGAKYHGIILDPPAFGHGPGGENWKLERDLNILLKGIMQLLEPENHFMLLNTYSLGFSPLIAGNLAKSVFKSPDAVSGEIFIQDKYGKKLPLGVFARVVRL